MTQERISAEMRVWDVLQRYPEAHKVFAHFGCPDMRKGVHGFTAHLLKLRWAAMVHHVDLDLLLADLNQLAARPRQDQRQLH